jgi:hypothetical protein
MIDKRREHFLEGLMYYLDSILFVRPVRRFIIRFIKKVLMRRPYEFDSQSLFAVYNCDIDSVSIVNASRYYDYAYRYKGEEKVVKQLRCLLKVLRRGVFIDVGAYVGFYTVLVARHGWKVVAFEPNPINAILLRYNIALHGVGDRVVVVDKAAGDAHGYARFSISTSLSESSFTKYLRD